MTSELKEKWNKKFNNFFLDDDGLEKQILKFIDENFVEEESVPAETLVMPKIAVLYKQNDIPTDLDNSKLKHYLDWECEKSNLIDFIVEITEVLKTDSNFTA